MRIIMHIIEAVCFHSAWQVTLAHASEYFRLKNKQSGKCLEVQGTTNWDAVQINECGDSHFQYWKWKGIQHFHEGEWLRKFGRLENRASGKCLDVLGDHPVTGDRVALYECTSETVQTKQFWHLHWNNFLWNSFFACLDVEGLPGINNGDYVATFACEFDDFDTTDHRWEMDPPPCTMFSCPANYMLKTSAENIFGTSSATCCEAAPTAYDQKYFQLKNLLSGKCLEAQGTMNLDVVRLWECRDVGLQFWRWRDHASPHTATTGALENQASGKCLDILGDSPEIGTQLAIWDCDTSNKRYWSLNADGFIVNIYGCLNIRGTPGTSTGDIATIWNCDSSSSSTTDQRWQMDPVSCTVFSCPAGYILKTDATDMYGSSQATCCDALCSIFSCPAGYTLKYNAGTFAGSDYGTCCDALCSIFSCPAGYTLKNNAGTIAGSDPGTCCDALCSIFSCPADYVLKTNAATITGSSQAACCDVACSIFSCPADYTLKNNAATIGGSDYGTCCDALCSIFSCPAGYTLKNNAGTIAGSDLTLGHAVMHYAASSVALLATL